MEVSDEVKASHDASRGPALRATRAACAAAGHGELKGPATVNLTQLRPDATYYVLCLVDTTAPVTFCLPEAVDSVFAVKLEGTGITTRPTGPSRPC